MTFRYIIAILLLLLPSIATAEVVSVQTESQQCTNGYACTVVKGYGSGVIVGTLRDGRAALLTAGHVVSGARSVHISWYKNQWLAATVLASRDDGIVDAAILAVNIPGQWECEPILETVPPTADVELWGFPDMSLEMRTFPGLLSGRTIQRVTAKQGMSGGPVIYDGKVAGIIRGHYRDGNRESICTPGPVLCAWLKETIGYVPTCKRDSPPKPAVKPSPAAIAPPPPRDDDGRVISMLESIDKRLRRIESMPLPTAERGEPGPPGERGPVGPRGEKGERGPAGIPADSREIAVLRSEIAAMKNARVKVQIKQNGTLVDEDTYPITGPIVLDFRATERRDVPASE